MSKLTSNRKENLKNGGSDNKDKTGGQQNSSIHTFFLSMLKLSIITPMKRLSVKKEPHTMKTTKYR